MIIVAHKSSKSASLTHFLSDMHFFMPEGQSQSNLFFAQEFTPFTLHQKGLSVSQSPVNKLKLQL